MSQARFKPNDAPERTHYGKQSFLLIATVLVVGIFASTLPQPQALGKLPLQHYLKGTLHVTKDQMSFFFLACGLFWYIKPLAGILTDAFPIFGTRRRYYLLFSSLLAAVAWIGLAFVPKTYNNLLIAAIVVNLFMVMMSTVIGAFLVEVGQSGGMTGKLTGVRQIAYNTCSLIQGPIAGYMAGAGLMIASGANAILVVSIFPIAYFMFKERRTESNRSQAFQNAGSQVALMLRSKPFLATLGFIFLFYFSPGFGTLQYFRQDDVMKLNDAQKGWLQCLGGVGGVMASIGYIWASRRFPIKALLLFGIVTAAIGTFFYLFYNTYALAFAIDFQNGLFFGFAETALIDLAARGTPAGAEGLGYGLLMAARNLSVFGADYVGTALSEKYHLPWSTMVSVNAITTAIVLIFLPFMPALLMQSKDGQTPNTENTGEPAAA